MLRLLVATVVVVVATVALTTGDARSVSTRDFLEREATTLLPPEARILSRRYEGSCYDFVVPESPPCLVVRFRAPSSLAARKAALLDLARGRWHVRAQDHVNGSEQGSELTFVRGELRARASLANGVYQRRCRSYRALDPSTCADYLHVEFGPPAIFPRIKNPEFLPELFDEPRR